MTKWSKCKKSKTPDDAGVLCWWEGSRAYGAGYLTRGSGTIVVAGMIAVSRTEVQGGFGHGVPFLRPERMFRSGGLGVAGLDAGPMAAGEGAGEAGGGDGLGVGLITLGDAVAGRSMNHGLLLSLIGLYFGDVSRARNWRMICQFWRLERRVADMICHCGGNVCANRVEDKVVYIQKLYFVKTFCEKSILSQEYKRFICHFYENFLQVFHSSV